AGDLRAAGDDAGGGPGRDADCVRERVEPARGARADAAARDCGADGARRRPRPRRAPAAHGSVRARRARRGARHRARGRGRSWCTEMASGSPPPFWITFDFDVRVLAFVTGLVGLATFSAGALPAIHATRVTPGAVLKDDSRGTTSAGLGRISGGLVIAELA